MIDYSTTQEGTRCVGTTSAAPSVLLTVKSLLPADLQLRCELADVGGSSSTQ